MLFLSTLGKTKCWRGFQVFIFIYFCLLAVSVEAQKPRYNEVYQVCTHNSYWVHRAAAIEPFATGTQERLLDQLIIDHARGLEIDIHKVRGKKGMWAVYHGDKLKNSFFETLPEFFKQLLQFQYALPKHEVVTVVLELKQIFGKNFNKNHTPEDLDKLIEQYMGPYLFKPDDLLNRCPGKTELCDCAASSTEIWPTTEELRGKFIFLVLGNLRIYGLGHGGLGWATYANKEHPACFPMSSDFSVFNKGGLSEKLPQAMLDRAYKASIFQQVENVGDAEHLKNIAKFIKKGGIVRGANSFALNEQSDRINAGFNFLQTDYPWLRISEKGFEYPFQPKDSARFKDANLFAEPGNRIFVHATDKPVFKNITIYERVSDWETLPSVTRPTPDKKYPNGTKPGCGCLQAQNTDGQTGFTVCREIDKHQNVIVSVKILEDGIERVKLFKGNYRTAGTAGDYIRMKVEEISDFMGKKTQVSIYSASSAAIDTTGNVRPIWNLLLSKKVSKSLIRQGILAQQGDVLFTGTRKNGNYVDDAFFSTTK